MSSEIISKFSDPELVPHVLLDTTLPKYKSTEQLPELQSSASQLLSQLDTYSQDITYQLETVLSELVRAKSRLNYEIDLLKSDLSALSNTTSIEARTQIEAASGSARTAKVISRLEKLDTVKRNMQKTQQIFTEAKNFDESKITSTVLSLVESGDIEAALAKLDSASEICLVWKGTALYTQRTKFIAGLRKRVDAIIAEKHRTSTSTPPPSGLSQLQSQSQPSTGTTPQPRSSTASPVSSTTADSYYSLIGQFQKKIF
ncbi:hypothetical protein AWJ20_4483 [Sugiyamaella lignohabitans]|uniref:Conserved oligomeric Golgi complex subunit 7 n=1 Tax=Sugiyamaella lignohabitans TaxID=796027 RepID=A0A167CGK9_9ASCO|nr:uncharacterized protein AWJ20_4483 [Sugiyamaella lignohabitans]ANB11662.1 hypothetical protein AWJ20_4483 [Sugiyamaella lignohabitans]